MQITLANICFGCSIERSEVQSFIINGLIETGAKARINVSNPCRLQRNGNLEFHPDLKYAIMNSILKYIAERREMTWHCINIRIPVR